MNGDPREPLSLEERELAQRLAQLRGGEPAPALDAAILAAARAELKATAATASAEPDTASATVLDIPRKPRIRWPAALGLAASVTLAVGIAWQLRTPPHPAAAALQEVAPKTSEADLAPAADALDTADAVPPPPPASAAETLAPPAASAAPIDAQGALFENGSNAVTQQQVASGKPASAEEPAPLARDRHSASDETSLSAPVAPKQDALPLPAARSTIVPSSGVSSAEAWDDPPLPAPSSPLPSAAVPADAGWRQEIASEPAAQAKSAYERDNNGQEQRRATSLNRGRSAFPSHPPAMAPAADMSVVEGAVTPIPPASWLQQIRDLHNQGSTNAAREQLRQFIRQYPDWKIPDDLAPLLQD